MSSVKGKQAVPWSQPTGVALARRADGGGGRDVYMTDCAGARVMLLSGALPTYPADADSLGVQVRAIEHAHSSLLL